MLQTLTPATQTIHTAEQLLEATDLPPCELVRGELRIISPASPRHGRLVMRISGLILNHVVERQLGEVYAADTGFWLERKPDTVRAPDIAFVSASRFSEPERGYFEGAPDLAVEMLSPDDRAGEVLEKVQDYLAAGTRSVWIIDPRSRTVTVYRQGGGAAVLRETDTLTDEVVPGFEIPVRLIFDPT
jgi:Uma2 family endonuclease